MENLKQTIKVIKALSDEGRLRIIALLDSRQDICVCEITAIIGLSQPTISSHLKLLESAGLIKHKKDGLWVNYSICSEVDPDIRILLDGIITAIRKSKTIKDDIRRLSRVDRNRLCSRNKPS